MQNPRNAVPLAWVWPMVAALAPLVFGVAWKDWLWWAALVAPCTSALATGCWRPWLGGMASLSWLVAWTWLGRDLPREHLLGGLGGLVGLLCCGWAMGQIAGPRSVLSAALMALVLCLFLTGAPAGFWLFSDPPWSPSLAARLLDVSPAALLMESAGVDFLRLPAVYGPVGADCMDPNLRLAWGNLAGWGVGVLGLCLSTAAWTCHRRKTVPERIQ